VSEGYIPAFRKKNAVKNHNGHQQLCWQYRMVTKGQIIEKNRVKVVPSLEKIHKTKPVNGCVVSRFPKLKNSCLSGNCNQRPVAMLKTILEGFLFVSIGVHLWFLHCLAYNFSFG
jgi:hypothetical protein